MNEPNFSGRDGFYWFTGVVEDRQDPEKLGRVRVRIIGWHTEDKTLIPTESLPWANVIQPITSASMCGVGETPLGPIPGTWVVGFFLDGQHAQQPLIMGTIPGKPLEPANPKLGFYDPRNNPKLTETLENSPKIITARTYHSDGSGITLQQETQTPNPKIVNEPDVNRLARNENIPETIIQTKKDNRDLNVPISFEGEWSEPETPFNPKYPYNHVKESESGHIEEIDDTPGFERTHKWHRAGTCEEIIMDGTRVVKVVGDNYEILLKDHNIHIMGDVQETIDKDLNLYIKGRMNLQVDGNVNLKVNGSVYEEIDGSVHQTVNGNVRQQIDGDLESKVSGNWEVVANGSIAFEGETIDLNSGRANPSSPVKPKQ